MKNLFGQFAQYYDLLYEDKDYHQEAIYIDKLIKNFSNYEKININILDLACGTGKHLFELYDMGYKVEGSDISLEMVEVVRNKCKLNNIEIPLYNESFQTAERIDKKYDVITALFSSINYIQNYNDFSITVKNIKKLLKKNGFFIFDFWNGNSVLKNYSPVRVKRAIKDDIEVIRVTDTTLNKITQIASLKFNFIIIKKNIIIHEFNETHQLRYFFPQEMVDLLLANNFDVIKRCPFMKENELISADDWNLTYVIKPIE